jgi:hypothetical protein
MFFTGSAAAGSVREVMERTAARAASQAFDVISILLIVKRNT